MALFLFLCGMSILKEWNLASFIFLCLFLCSFQLSQGSVAWLYIPEVTVDAASGFAAGAQFINAVLLTFTFEFMINSPLKLYGSIWFFCALTFLGFIFCLFFARETQGLTDLQKKTLYSPKTVEPDQFIMELQEKQKKQDTVKEVISKVEEFDNSRRDDDGD